MIWVTVFKSGKIVYAVNLYGNGANVSSLNASNLSSGTVPAARLPNHSASLLTSGTIPDARISGNFLKVRSI